MIAAAVTNIKPEAIRRMTSSRPRGESRPVSSKQARTHPRLPSLLHKHLTSQYREPVADYNLLALETVVQRIQVEARPLILDSFCGTGHSTAQLAGRYPGHLVVGIDKSASRLARHAGGSSANYLMLQGDCEPLWMLLAQVGLRVQRHYLLYPNPWPKPKHLGRRVHGHPGFASLLRLGGIVEVRSNWQLYVEEFGLATQLAGYPGSVSRLDLSRESQEHSDLTLFERKYRLSGHALWTFRVDLSSSPVIDTQMPAPRSP